MISDTVDRLPLYEALIPEAGKIARAFQSKVPSDVSCEVREKSYALKEDTARRFEVHFHTIDLMIAREGAETIHICPMEQLTPAEALPNGGDGCKMTGEPQGLAHVLNEGFFCAIFPGEAHMVAGKLNDVGQIDKWVVKVPCTENFRRD